MDLRKLKDTEVNEALELVWKVFLKHEASDYAKEGVEEFKSILENKEFIAKLVLYGAFDNNKIVGVLAMRKPQHISLFFVDENYHKKGIGRSLFELMKQDYEEKEFTVNSSPYAVEVYKHLGFVPTSSEKTTNGIRYTPMKYGEN